jgi:hypothetical protein
MRIFWLPAQADGRFYLLIVEPATGLAFSVSGDMNPGGTAMFRNRTKKRYPRMTAINHPDNLRKKPKPVPVGESKADPEYCGNLHTGGQCASRPMVGFAYCWNHKCVSPGCGGNASSSVDFCQRCAQAEFQRGYSEAVIQAKAKWIYLCKEREQFLGQEDNDEKNRILLNNISKTSAEAKKCVEEIQANREDQDLARSVNAKDCDILHKQIRDKFPNLASDLNLREKMAKRKPEEGFEANASSTKKSTVQVL